MSQNEENNTASQDAPAGSPTPASDATPPTTPSKPDTRTTSRFYSRLNRGQSPAKAPAASGPAPVSTEGLDPEEAAHLKDNLPVRATLGDKSDAILEDGPREGRSFDREDDGDRRGRRGRDRDRGYDRDRDRDRDRGHGRGERGRDRDRDRERREPRAEAPAPAESSAPASEAPAMIEGPSAPVAQTSAPAPSEAPAKEAPRRLRFEDAHPDHGKRAVQEFRPSRDRSYAEDADRARRQKEDRSAPKAKPSGLLGWMKSIFTSDGEAGPAKEESAPSQVERPRDRGPRQRGGQGPRQGQGFHGQGGQGGQGGSSQEQDEGKRRRRRRRGGRNRNREGGDSGPATEG